VPTSGTWVERYGGTGCILVEMLRTARESAAGVLPCRLLGLDKAGDVASATVASRRSPDIDPATAMTTTAVVKSKPAKAFALSQRSNVRWSSGDMDLQIRANSLPLMSLPRRALTGRHGSVSLRRDRDIGMYFSEDEVESGACLACNRAHGPIIPRKNQTHALRI
jgi:hypothetical protein